MLGKSIGGGLGPGVQARAQYMRRRDAARILRRKGTQVPQVLQLPQESQVPQVSWLPQVSITGAAGPRRCHGSGRRSRGAPQVPRESHETQAPRRDYINGSLALYGVPTIRLGSTRQCASCIQLACASQVTQTIDILFP